MVLGAIVTTALEKAVSSGAQHLDEARKEVAEAKKYNAASCVRYLAAARTAVLALEDEVDEILIEAGFVARYDWARRSELHRRLERYLRRDQLRPILDGALHGIRECFEVASRDSAVSSNCSPGGRRSLQLWKLCWSSSGRSPTT